MSHFKTLRTDFTLRLEETSTPWEVTSLEYRPQWKHLYTMISTLWHTPNTNMHTHTYSLTHSHTNTHTHTHPYTLSNIHNHTQAHTWYFSSICCAFNCWITDNTRQTFSEIEAVIISFSVCSRIHQLWSVECAPGSHQVGNKYLIYNTSLATDSNTMITANTVSKNNNNNPNPPLINSAKIFT